MHHKEQLTSIIEIEEAFIGKRTDGIIHVYFKPHTEINIPLQEKLVRAYNEITNKEKSLFIFEAGPYCSVTKEARENAIIIEDQTPTKASVVVVQNLAYKLVANFYYKFNKPKQPFMVVSNFNDGIKWLKRLK